MLKAYTLRIQQPHIRTDSGGMLMFRLARLGVLVAPGLLALVPLVAEAQLSDWPLTPAEERALKPRDEFRECPSCPRIVVVPAGTFAMGSPDSEEGRDSDEGPQQKVTVPQPFAVGKFEITFDEWDACAAGGGCNGYRPSDLGWGRGRQPVFIVSWDDAKAYVAWLSATTGRTYRLLSEAEWEYVARGGSTTPFSFGASISTREANYDGTVPYANAKPGELRQRTLPVGSFKANAFGLHDVHGNVWEWVEDCWHRRHSDMPDDVRKTAAPWVSGDCTTRVFRGGSWADGAAGLRSANRGRYEPYIRNTNSGFRVARTLSR